MRWHTARQCWHDCTFLSRPSVMAVAVENANLGASVQKSNVRHDTTVHHVESGMVQAAISTLPRHLRELGDWLYAPFTAEERAHRVLPVATIVNEHAGLEALDPDPRTSHWMPLVIATLYEYARVVLGEDVQRRNGKAIRRWIFDELHLETRPWERQERRIYEQLWSAINDLDRQALVPVTRLLNKQRDKYKYKQT